MTPQECEAVDAAIAKLKTNDIKGALALLNALSTGNNPGKGPSAGDDGPPLPTDDAQARMRLEREGFDPGFVDNYLEIRRRSRTEAGTWLKHGRARLARDTGRTPPGAA
jgi:hypothetical protein